MKKCDRSILSILLAAILVIAGGVRSSAAADGAPGVEERADRILREMGEYLKTASEFTFKADISYDSVETSGEKIEYGGVAKVAVHRPDRLHWEYVGDELQRQSQAIINGSRFVLYKDAENLYSRADVPSDLDGAIDHLVKKYGFPVPTADLVYADPYSILIENVESGFLVGLHPVDGTPCHHLAFSQEAIDWQIWIEDGPRPVPRKLVVTYKNEPSSPQYTARLSGWDFQPRLSDRYFQFHPPAGASEIEFLPIQEREVKR